MTALGHDGACRGRDMEIRLYDLADPENGMRDTRWASAHLRYAVIPAVVGRNPEWMPDAKTALGHDGACRGRI